MMSLATEPVVARAIAAAATIDRHQHHDEVGSTNDLARIEAAGDGVLVTADRQTAGRGRRGRTWIDGPLGPSPANLAVSLALPLPKVGAPLAPLAAGLAVGEAYTRAGAAPRLKWPNDVLLDGRKAAGILVERHRSVHGEVLVIGCGLDLDWRGVQRDLDQQQWTSLAEVLDAPVERAQILADLVTALDRELVGLTEPGQLVDRYRAVCDTLGAEVAVTLPGGARLAGRAVAVDDDGTLVVDTGRERVSVRAGDVALVRSG